MPAQGLGTTALVPRVGHPRASVKPGSQSIVRRHARTHLGAGSHPPISQLQVLCVLSAGSVLGHWGSYSERRDSVSSQGACSLLEELQAGRRVSRLCVRGQVVQYFRCCRHAVSVEIVQC